MTTQANTTRHDAPSGALAKAATLIAAKSLTRAWKAVAPIAVAVVLALLPVPTGLPPHAWYFFSIFVGVIVGLVLEPLPGAAIALIGLTLVAVLGPFVLFSPQQLSQPGFRAPSAALQWTLSGYSNPTVWLIFGAFILALGYERTGLGERSKALHRSIKLGCNEARKGWTPLPARTHPGGDCRARAGSVGWGQCFHQRNNGCFCCNQLDVDHPSGDVERYYG